MYTLAELNVRLNHLQSLSPQGGRQVIAELRSAIEAYMTRDSDFELQVNKTLDKVIADTFFHGLQYENSDLIKKWMTYPTANQPEGYGDISKIFKGAEIFEEIMTVTDNAFRMAFYSESKDSGDSGYATTEYHNRYVDDWVVRLNIAIKTELENLKSIMHYCANRSYNVEWAILFEELGKNVERHPVRYYAKQIYWTRGWGWLIETFNLNVYLPSYFNELPNWTEED